jgi:hypothetical protein
VNYPNLTAEQRASILHKHAAQSQNGGLAYGPKLFDRPMGNIQKRYFAKPMGSLVDTRKEPTGKTTVTLTRRDFRELRRLIAFIRTLAPLFAKRYGKYPRAEAAIAPWSPRGRVPNKLLW